MKKSIYNFAIQHGEIKRDALCEMCDMMSEDMRTRFVETILGISDPCVILADLKRVQDFGNHKNCRLVDFNYLFDTVSYEYDETKTLHFSTEAMALSFTKEGTCAYNGQREEDEEHPFVGTHTFTYSNEDRLSRWLQGDEFVEYDGKRRSVRK